MATSFTMQPILISGAGLGGLLLARSLRQSQIPFLLYERDESVASRAQGYRIRISSDGLSALQEVLPPDLFAKFKAGCSTTGGGGIHSLNAVSAEPRSVGKPKADAGGPGKPQLGGDVLGVARGFLRERLFEGMEDSVRWGKRSVGYTLSSSGVKLNFSDGSHSPDGAMLIAADGPQSAVTKQLTDGKVRAYDTGARMVHGQTPARAFTQLGYGVWMVQDEHRAEGPLSLITNVRPSTDLNGDEELGWVFAGGPGTFTAPGDNFSLVGKVAADLSRSLTGHWHEKFKPIFEQQNDKEAAFLKMSTAHPDGVPDWPNEPRVTVLGDAVHCMTPAGGVGANTALRDAALIGKLLKQAGGYKDDVTGTYEREMRSYASPNVKMSFEAAAERFKITELK
nr:fad-dependent monooxygenase cctm [Quercus suber]